MRCAFTFRGCGRRRKAPDDAPSRSSREGNPLTQLESFKAFTAGIKDRCVEMPVTMELQQVGRYDHLA